MEASRMFTAGAGDLAARSGVPCTPAVRWPASPTRLLASRHCVIQVGASADRALCTAAKECLSVPWMHR
jgi:hypothetical protein